MALDPAAMDAAVLANLRARTGRDPVGLDRGAGGGREL
jgi:hypothetical protein